MSAATMQLHTYKGASSRAFAGNDGKSLWRNTYSRISPFALVDHHQNCEDKLKNAGSGGTKYITLDRNGDLLANSYVHFKFTPTGAALKGLVRNTAIAALKTVSIYIGSQEVDRYTNVEAEIQKELLGQQYGDMTFDYDRSLTYVKSTAASFVDDLGDNVESSQGKLCDMSQRGTSRDADTVIHQYVPLSFWYCQHPSLAIPMVALMYHDVKLGFELRSGAANSSNYLQVTAHGSNGNKMESATVYTANVVSTYVLLSNDEREAMANSTFEQLCCQHQRVQETKTLTAGTAIGNANATVDSYTIDCVFNHPVSLIAWVGHLNTVTTSAAKDEYPGNGDPLCFMGPSVDSGVCFGDMFDTAQLKLNGSDRFSSDAKASYFRQVQPIQHFGRVPKNYVYCYSFAQHPGVWTAPTGHVNMSRIDNIQLKLEANNTGAADSIEITVCAWNLNILRYSNGLGGARYSA